MTGTEATAAPTLSGIDACLFDAYGTLFDVHAPVDAVAAELGGDASAVSALWRQKQIQYTWLRSLMGAHAPFETVTTEALDHALAAHGVGTPDVRARLLALYRELAAYPEVPTTLSALRAAGVRTGILSNGDPGMIADATRAAGIDGLLDVVLSADAVGMFKPDARVYQLGPDRLNRPAARIAFVSANAWDVAGAAHFGYPVIWVNRFGQQPEHLPGRPAAVVDTLAGVAEHLTGPRP
jgi:2-haloacid dehalogenase